MFDEGFDGIEHAAAQARFVGAAGNRVGIRFT